MPSLSASVPADKLKVMRPGKPVARQVPYQTAAGSAAGGVSAGSAGGGVGAAGVDPVSDAGIATKKLMPGAPTMARGPMQPKPATGGGFQFRPRDMVGGPAMMPGGGGDIQTAIKSLRGQLGMPTPAAPGGPSLEPWQQGGGSPDASASAVAPPARAVPPWKQLADLGVGGQGSAAGNRAKLAELLAARTGGGGAAGTEPGGGMVGGGRFPNSGGDPNASASFPSAPRGSMDPIWRSQATVPDAGFNPGGGVGGATLAGNQGPMGPGPTAPGGSVQNPYMDILGRRLAGFGGGGRSGFNPSATVPYAG